jgi:RNA polymerase sigma-70 factor (ECF subfamily)
MTRVSGRTTLRQELGKAAEQHRRQLARLVRRHVDSDDEADEVAQAAVARALERLHEFRGDAALGTWLGRIAMNLAIDWRRRKSRRREADGEAEPTTSPFRTTRVVARDTVRRLGALIAEIPPRQRAVVELRLLKELSFKEIAEALGCTEEAARASFHLGLKTLRGAYESRERSRPPRA